MTVYMDAVMLLNFLVDFLLILGTNRLTGFPPCYRRSMVAAAFGAFYAGLTMLPEVRFLGNMLWRTVFLVLISVMAFGLDKTAVSRGAVFILLSMALGGIASGIGILDFWILSICGLLLWLLCRMGFAGGIGKQAYVEAELNWQGKKIRLLALQDTGNMLRDPLTGEQVLVCGADVGEELLGLPRKCFSDPAGTIASGIIPGFRLLPYRTVGQPGSMMLAIRLNQAKIGNKTGNPLVAFAPQEIGKGEGYRMLTGGLT